MASLLTALLATFLVLVAIYAYLQRRRAQGLSKELELLQGKHGVFQQMQAVYEKAQQTSTENLIAKNSELQLQINLMTQYESQIQLLNKKLLDKEKTLGDLNSELQRSNIDLDRFASLAAHDLRAPLRAVNFLVDAVREDNEKSLDPTSERNMLVLKKMAGRMSHLVESLLLYSRPGPIDSSTEKVDCEQLVGEIFAAHPESEKATLDCQQLPVLNTNRLHLSIVLRSLICNALKHNPKDRSKVIVTCETLEPENSFCFRVEDDGPGIDPYFFDDIFGFLTTLQSKDKIEGSGMGLAIVKRIVERRGGSVGVERSVKGKGSTFFFTWPRIIDHSQKVSSP